MSASFVVPVGPDFQDVIQVPLVDNAKAFDFNAFAKRQSLRRSNFRVCTGSRKRRVELSDVPAEMIVVKTRCSF